MQQQTYDFTRKNKNLWLVVLAVGRLACEIVRLLDLGTGAVLEQSYPEFAPQMRGFPTMLQENHEQRKTLNLKLSTSTNSGPYLRFRGLVR
jgi:hypothetical protein